MGPSQFRSTVGRYIFIGTGFTCPHLKSPESKPEHSDAVMMYAFSLIKYR